jgi:hypothetical protein
MERTVITRDRRAVLIFWLVVLGLILTAFAADGLLRDEVCTGAQIADAHSTITYPIHCE